VSVRDRRYADQRQRACLGRNDRKADDDPIDVLRTDKIVLDGPLRLSKKHAKNSDAHEVGGQDNVVYPGKSHISVSADTDVLQRVFSNRKRARIYKNVIKIVTFQTVAATRRI